MFFLLILLATISRIVPHPPNFTPILAITLFSAATIKPNKAFLIPLLSLFLSDLGIEVLYRLGLSYSWGIYPGMIFNYLFFLVISLIGLLIRKKFDLPTVAFSTMLSIIFFFLASNFVVWATSGMYPHSSEGLITCYIAALPFLQWSVIGDFCFVGLFFGAYAFSENINELDIIQG